ncbi:enoyl-CoA hydratase-related protein [Leekyejoonella antrihumi]|uniref:Enoyl-CoA hydratase n=1 Tax=Leekyejoonella antrihumi TaxID=1660198 RepID=A0A563DV62_9MICO|nr:enoyl-CoA hydratase-related protein [Leekyejoonella antrihumi]TWP33813.1 enoyl-CoA hydratase [Leekyejoonella antrihumi]
MPVATERIHHSLVVRIDREEKRNAIDAETTEGLDAALNDFEDDAELWVAIITGTESVFSAGSDLKGSGATSRGGEYGVIRRRSVKPILAAVEGPALGGGLEIALACDLVVASSTATFGLPETLRGLVPTSGALLRATRRLPANIAHELMITGRCLSAQRAYDVGFVNELTTAGKALEAALALAEEICRSSPYAVQQVLGALREQDATLEQTGWDVTDRAKARVASSHDAAEGVAAFFERRPPRWAGS